MGGVRRATLLGHLTVQGVFPIANIDRQLIDSNLGHHQELCVVS